VLLIGAGLLIQSLFRLQQVNLGFRSDRLMTFQLSLPVSKYPPPAKAFHFYKPLLESLGAIPGVRAAAISSGCAFRRRQLHHDSHCPGRKLRAAGRRIHPDRMANRQLRLFPHLGDSPAARTYLRRTGRTRRSRGGDHQPADRENFLGHG